MSTQKSIDLISSESLLFKLVTILYVVTCMYLYKINRLPIRHKNSEIFEAFPPRRTRGFAGCRLLTRFDRNKDRCNN